MRHPLIQWVDERLSASLDELPSAAKDDEPYILDCPLCKAQVFYNDPDDEVVQVKCCICSHLIDLWLGKTYLPREAKVANDDMIESYH